MAPHAEEPISAFSTAASFSTDLPFVENLNNYVSLGCIYLSQEANLEILFDNPTNKTIRNFVQSLQIVLVNATHEAETSFITAFTKVLEHGWIRVSTPPGLSPTHTKIIRIHILPHDVGHRYISRERREVQFALQAILPSIDTSSFAWSGKGTTSSSSNVQYFDPWAIPEDCSLFYLFNTLPSPAPRPDAISDRYSRYAVKQLLQPSRYVNGLRTPLYPYQARSAAMMIQKEAAVQLQLDPRLEIRTAPDGEKYYYDAKHSLFLQNARFYDSNRGGILAETMGLGKTIICLAVILATRHHLPRTPQQYVPGTKMRESVGSLGAMAATALQRASVPSRSYFVHMSQEHGHEMTECIRELDNEPAEYVIPGQPLRMRRQVGTAPSKTMRLCSGTIIVVPRNLVHQWKAEISKHVEADIGLKVLVMDSGKAIIPPSAELQHYDVVLFSRTRFEQEFRDGSDSKGRRRAAGATPLSCNCPYIGATRTPDCRCLKEDDLYRSPIKDLHWLRIIIDEGHEFSSSSSIAVTVANRLVTAERRWVVSGTPARDRLFGVEVDLAVHEDFSTDPSPSPRDNESQFSTRDYALEQRRTFDMKEEANGAARSLGLLASHFLQVKPWSETYGQGARIDWGEYIFRHEDYRQRTFSAFTSCLRRTMENMIVKTQPEDVEKDIVLPPLEHRVVYLEPSFHDKTIFNLFVLFLTANAVTSEREGRDYLFHKESGKARGHLLANLRQSSFFWTGFTEQDIEAAIGHGETYLAKPLTEVKCTSEDRVLLSQCLEFARMLLLVTSWKALSRTHEVGLFVDEWPSESRTEWNLDDPDNYLMSGVTQLLTAQTFIDERLALPEPTEGLAELGKEAIAQAHALAEDQPKKNASQQVDGDGTMAGLPTSGMTTDTSSVKQHYAVSTGRPSLAKKSPKKGKKEDASEEKTSKGSNNPNAADTSSRATPRKRRRSSVARVELPADSPLKNTSIIGTTSAKLSYLLDKIVALNTQEKILVFYDGDNTAYYVAQCLELLHIKHLIYAKSLKLESKSKYIVTFDQDDSVRVLLMDIRCGALGLNVNKASRVFFINPCNRPSIEAQAIKRAHRIGQDKPVYVETLVLKGTVEERIFARSKTMTRTEHVETRVLEDDEEISNIIKSARPLPLEASDAEGKKQMAGLLVPQQLFGRAGRGNSHIQGIDKEKLEAEEEESKGKKRKTGKKVARIQTPGAGADDGVQVARSPNVEITVPIMRTPPLESIFGNGERYW